MTTQLSKTLFGRGMTVAAGLLLWMWCLGARPAFGIHSDRFPDVGNHLPALEFTDLEGEGHRIDWDRRQHRATILFFFEPRCADCLREMIFLDSLNRAARDFGLEVYAVEGSGLAATEVEEALQKYRRFYGEPSFPVIADPEYALSSLFGIQRLPSGFLMERHGVILSRNESFGNRVAIDVARKTERLLKVAPGFLSSALRDLEIDAKAEREMEESLALSKPPAGRDVPLRRRLAAGDAVPGFEFTDLGGATGRWRPASGEGGVTIVFFWGALCLPCIEEMAFLDEVFTSARVLGLDVIAVEGSGLSPDRTSLVIDRYRRFHPLPSYRIVPDPGYRLAALFGVNEKLPQTFLIDGAGVIRYHTDRFVKGHEEDLTRRIELALSLEPGGLGRRMASKTGGGAPPFIPEEAPSILAGVERAEEFRSNLVEGDTYYRNWQFGRALPHYLRCLELEPGYVSVRVRVAEIYQRQGNLEEALANWRKVLESEPENSQAATRVRELVERGVAEKGEI